MKPTAPTVKARTHQCLTQTPLACLRPLPSWQSSPFPSHECPRIKGSALFCSRPSVVHSGTTPFSCSILIFLMDSYPALVSWVQYCFTVFLPLEHAISHPGNSPVPKISQISMEHLTWVNGSCDYRHSLFLAWAPHTFTAWFLPCLSYCAFPIVDVYLILGITG